MKKYFIFFLLINCEIESKQMNDIQKASNNIFREYDIRGTVGVNYFIQNNYEIGKAIATYFKRQNKSIKNIAIGMDGRLHSKAIKSEICKAFLDSGLNVTFIGLCSTPAFYFANKTLEVDGGVMITASHNPKEDNGLKIILANEPVWAKQIQEIRNIYSSPVRPDSSSSSELKDILLHGIEEACTEQAKRVECIEGYEQQKGNYLEQNINEAYVHYLFGKFSHLIGIDLNCAIDCGNGSAGTAIPMLVEKMQWKNIKLLNEKIDGNFPDHEPDPSIEKNLLTLKNCIKENNLEFGMALDGDCDRFAAITKNGNPITSDQMIGLFSLSLDQKSAVFDVMCSNQILEQFEQYGIKTYLTKTGCSNIKECMKQNNALLGGELSGHFCFKDKYFGYDDGIYALLRFVEVIYNSKKTVEQLLEKFPKTNLIFISSLHCSEENKFKIIEEVKNLFKTKTTYKIIDIDGIRLTNEFGCAILRASNTESILRLKLEAKNQENLIKLKEEFYNILTEYFDKNILKEKLNI